MPDGTVNCSSRFLSPACLSRPGVAGVGGFEGAQVARMALQVETNAASMRLVSCCGAKMAVFLLFVLPIS